MPTKSRKSSTPSTTKTQPLPILEIRKILKHQLSLLPNNCISTIGSTGNTDNVEVYDKLSSLLYGIVTRGESNSLLIVGAPGNGKSSLLQSSLSDLHNNEETTQLFQEVYLNGLNEKNERLALKSIVKQLQIKEEVDPMNTGSFAENLHFVLQSLKTGDRNESQPIIFILDHFEMFCLHHRQSLLYNLFDVAQSNQAPIGVIGLTSRLDAVELLEKRVKSRFSNRVMFIHPPRTYKEYITTTENLLQINSKDSGKAWNDSIKLLLKNSQVQDCLKCQYDWDHSYRGLKTMLFYVVCKLNENHPQIVVDDFTAYVDKTFLDLDPKILALKNLSTLELSMVLAMLQIDRNYDEAPFTFELVLSEYTKHATRRASLQCQSRAVMMKTFENIVQTELIIPVKKSTKQAVYLPEFILYQLTFRKSHLQCALDLYKNLPTDLKMWCDSV